MSEATVINLDDFKECDSNEFGGAVVLHARIRVDSKYYGQTPAGEIFPVNVVPSRGGYVIRGKPGDYRSKDVDVFAVVSGGELVQISEEKRND